MKSSTALAAILLMGQAFACLPTHAAMITAQRQEPDEVTEVDPAITAKIKALDEKIAGQEQVIKIWNDKIENLGDRLDSKTSIRDNMGGKTTVGRRVVARWQCSEMENYSNSCQQSIYYGSDICSHLRSCRTWYNQNKVGDATLNSLREQVRTFESLRNDSEELRDSYAEQRAGLLKSDGRELRDPRDLSELRGEQTMQFKELLALNPGNNGNAQKEFDDCSFLATPFTTSELGIGPWVTGGTTDKSSWKIVFMNTDPVYVTDEAGCGNRLSVHKWRERECRIGVRMDGHYDIPVSVVLENDKGKFLNVEPSGTGKGKKEVLACLTKRGFSPAKILAKSKSLEASVVKPTEISKGADAGR